jgi:MHS family citrate/tricarballylate:H+ symporter-like MFS transporter
MHPSPSTLSSGRSKAAAVFRVTAGNFLEQFDFFGSVYATQIANAICYCRAHTRCGQIGGLA